MWYGPSWSTVKLVLIISISISFCNGLGVSVPTDTLVAGEWVTVTWRRSNPSDTSQFKLVLCVSGSDDDNGPETTINALGELVGKAILQCRDPGSFLVKIKAIAEDGALYTIANSATFSVLTTGPGIPSGPGLTTDGYAVASSSTISSTSSLSSSGSSETSIITLLSISSTTSSTVSDLPVQTKMSVLGESKISGEPMAGTKRYRSSIIALSVLLALLISAIAITVIILGLRRKRSGYRFIFGSLFHTPLILARLFSRIKITPSDAGDLAIIRSQSSVLRDTDSNHPHNAEPDAGQTLIPGRQSAHLKDRVTDLEMALRDAREHFEDTTTDIQRMHVEIRRLTVQLASERRDVLPPRYSAGD